MVEFEPNRASGFLGNRISDDIWGRNPQTDDREMRHYSMIVSLGNKYCYILLASHMGIQIQPLNNQFADGENFHLYFIGYA